MLHKWRFILTNWINCYFNESPKKEQCVTTESILTIISHLRENLNLDESKSSILEAHTVEEFIREKYPEFKFENGTIEATNEEEVHIIASLLLYFVCVTSKDVDIKTAMCSKLGQVDQETILKFSKCLMECSAISYRDVQAAITEACGQDIAAGETAAVKVAETPPALRSLHGEVRRLQAALDAERFDRNYLQDELGRTNLRLEKLLKDKEQCKLDIMNLKAKISMCCGQEAEVKGGDAAIESTARLTRQLQDLEERLVTTQGQLDDVQYERDTYKAKVDELKHERDKWLAASQQETSRASQLADELETERRNTQSLREIVTELRQHHQKNCLDSSQLECDDPDASIRSLNNVSVCSEACANVVEVQLGEERAKIVVLKQQIQTLQDQLNDLTQKAENEVQTLQGILYEKDDDIFNLKHRINEEIEEKNNLRSHYGDEFIRLNNELNELEQKLKDNSENSRAVIEQKMQEIKTLQEEKLSLLQSLSDETTKLENIIKDLRTDIDTEKNLKIKMRDDYENHMMKLNEKVLNRNNELVELQNNVFEKSEMIEQLHLDLRKEREAMEDLANKYHSDIAELNHERRDVEHNLQQKTEEAKELQRRLQQNVAVFEEFNKEIDDLKSTNSNLAKDLDEKNATTNTLQTQLQDEINYKTQLQNELEQVKTNLSEEINKLNAELTDLKKEIHDKDRIIYAIDLYLKEEKHTNKTLTQNCETISEERNKLLEELHVKDNDIKTLECKLENDSKLFEEELCKRDDLIEAANGKLATEISERSYLQSTLASLKTEKDSLEEDLKQKYEEMLQLQAEHKKLTEITEKSNDLIDTLENRIDTENKKYSELQNNLESQSSHMMAKLNESEIAIREYNTKYRNTMEEKELQLQTWKIEVEKMQKIVDSFGRNIEKMEKENEDLSHKLNEEITYKNKFEKEYHNQCAVLNNVTTQLNEEIVIKNEEITTLKKEIETLSDSQKQCNNTVTQLNEEIIIKNEDITSLKHEVASLSEYQNKCAELNNVTAQLSEQIVTKNEEIGAKNEEITSLKKEIDSLSDYQKQCTILTNTLTQLNEEILTKTEDITSLKKQVESLSEYQNKCDELNNITTQLSEEIVTKNEEIITLQEDVASLFDYQNQCVELNKIITQLNEEVLKLKKDVDSLSQYQTQCAELKSEIVKKDEELSVLKKDITNLSQIESQYLELNNVTTLLNEQIVLQNEEIMKLKKEADLLSEYQNKCAELNNITSQLSEEIVEKNEEISVLKKEVKTLSSTVDNKAQEINDLQGKISSEIKYSGERRSEVKNLKNKIDELTSLNSELKNEIATKVQGMDALQKENEQLHFTIEEDNSNHEVLIKDKDIMIEKLEEQFKNTAIQLDSIRKEYEDSTLMWETFKVEMRANLEAKDNEINALNETISDLKHNLEQLVLTTDNEKKELKTEIDDLFRDSEIKRREQVIELLAELTQLERDNKALEDDLEEEKASRDALETENKELSTRVEALVLVLSHEQSQYSTLNEENKALLDEKMILTQQLFDEKSVRQLVEQEKQELATDKDNILQQLFEETATNSSLMEENEILNEKLQEETTIKTTILQEKECLSQQLNEEVASKNDILQEKERISLQLNEEISLKNRLSEAKESLSQQLVEEKSAKELVEKEKESLEIAKEALQQKLDTEIKLRDNLEEVHATLVQQKHDLIQEINTLNMQLIAEVSSKDILQEEKIKLVELLEEEKLVRGELFNEKECLLDENESLKHNVIELKTVQEALMNDKEILSFEKETITKSLNKEKAARDELETEKKTVTDKLDELKEKSTLELIVKQEELQNIAVELNHLKSDLKKHEELNVQVSSVLNSGLDKLLQSIKQQNIYNELLQKLVTVEKCEDMSSKEKCDLLINIADTLTTEVSLRKNLEKALEHENSALNEMTEMFKQKEMQVHELQIEVNRLQQIIQDNKAELSKQIESHNASIESQVREIRKLQTENQSLKNDLNDVKIQLEVKVHSLKEKLTDNEILTDKLKKTYECQIDNLNMMVTKLTGYLKDKAVELESLRKEKDRLQHTIDDSCKVIKTLEDEVKCQKQSQEKLISDFESERLVLKNMVTVTESVMEDQKVSLNKVISEHVKDNETLQQEVAVLQKMIDTERKNLESKIQEKAAAFEVVFKDLTELRNQKENLQKDSEIQVETLNKDIFELEEELNKKVSCIETLELQNHDLANTVMKYKEDIAALELKDNELKIKKDSLEFELLSEIDKLTKVLRGDIGRNESKCTLQEKLQTKHEIHDKVKVLGDIIIDLVKETEDLDREKNEFVSNLEKAKISFEEIKQKTKDEIDQLKQDKVHLVNIIEENKKVISNMEQLIQHELDQNRKLREVTESEKLNLGNQCTLLQEYQVKAEKLLEDKDKEISALKENVDTVSSNCAKHWNSIIKTYQTNAEKLEEELEGLKSQLNAKVQDLKDKQEVITKFTEDKESITKQLMEERSLMEKYKSELETKAATLYELRQKLEETKNDLEAFKKENEELVRVVGQRETFAVGSFERLSSHKLSSQAERELRDRHQVSTPTSDLTHSSMESLKTITDLEKIIHDKNRTITTLQCDITYMKTLMAESENKLLDVNKEVEVSKESCQQLSDQLKKIVHLKNEEIMELKRQISKMSVTENRATQIIKVSAKYQAMILKRVAEIKSNTILKELTNFGNASNGENEFRRGLNSGAITMEDLESFLETTDRHLKRCSEKQLTLQKERDRLIEVNRINESEIINLKKFLTELSISFKTFSSVKDLYTQKLSKVVSVQRTVRREILNLDGFITDAMMCKLERGYAAVMQDLAECVMNLERWVERCIARTISPEKIKQAFTSDTERTSLANTSFQNAGLEVQLEELENSFQKLLEEVVRAQKGEGAKDAQAITVMEVRAEYEDKLNRMKAKMKQLYQEQISVFKEKQKDEIATLERELQKAREKLAESSRGYEEHIRALTTELWSVGEKFLMQKDEAEWLRKKQRSGSLMSLQHVHSSGLVAPQEVPSRPSDSHSLRSLPVTTMTNPNREKRDKEGRGLHMSDEEGEVFDNRWLKELSATPRRESLAPPGQRLSELRWRNSLCPPHLKSSYPAETQFTQALDEEDIKCVATANGGRTQRKEVGITAYKKPGPPTPSKQAGRLSATDSELRESLRVDAEPHPSRKTSTPSRLRALFRSSRSDAVDGTPRRRLSNIFRKK